MNNQPPSKDEEMRKAWAEYRTMLNIAIHAERSRVIFWRFMTFGMCVVCAILVIMATRR